MTRLLLGGHSLGLTTAAEPVQHLRPHWPVRGGLFCYSRFSQGGWKVTIA